MDSKRRTFVKSSLWVALGWAMMMLVGFAVTGSWAAGGVMAAINSLIGFVAYVFYERMWARITWGRGHG